MWFSAIYLPVSAPICTGYLVYVGVIYLFRSDRFFGTAVMSSRLAANQIVVLRHSLSYLVCLGARRFANEGGQKVQICLFLNKNVLCGQKAQQETSFWA